MKIGNSEVSNITYDGKVIKTITYDGKVIYRKRIQSTCSFVSVNNNQIIAQSNVVRGKPIKLLNIKTNTVVAQSQYGNGGIPPTFSLPSDTNVAYKLVIDKDSHYLASESSNYLVIDNLGTHIYPISQQSFRLEQGSSTALGLTTTTITAVDNLTNNQLSVNGLKIQLTTDYPDSTMNGNVYELNNGKKSIIWSPKFNYNYWFTAPIAEDTTFYNTYPQTRLNVWWGNNPNA